MGTMNRPLSCWDSLLAHLITFASVDTDGRNEAFVGSGLRQRPSLSLDSQNGGRQITTALSFASAYAWGDHRGTKQSLCLESSWDVFFIGLILLLGGLCANLFGIGADILLYSLLVTRFRMSEKNATRICIMLMAGTSVFGFGYRHVIEAGLQADQYKTWICAYPVVLFMAPFGALVLSKINVEWMIKGTTSPDASSQPCGPDEPSTANLPHTDQGEIAV
jgi:hypothetical protein